MRPQHRKFATEYVRNGFNGVQAVLSAGYNQTYGAARVTASRLLTSANIMDVIDNAASILSDDEILKEISKVAKSNVDLKGSDKMKGLELLAKHRGLIKDRIETTDLTEQSSLSTSLDLSIKQAMSRDGLDRKHALIGLFDALRDDPQFSNVKIWPEGDQSMLAEHLKPQTTEPQEFSGEM